MQEVNSVILWKSNQPIQIPFETISAYFSTYKLANDNSSGENPYSCAESIRYSLSNLLVAFSVEMYIILPYNSSSL